MTLSRRLSAWVCGSLLAFAVKQCINWSYLRWRKIEWTNVTPQLKANFITNHTFDNSVQLWGLLRSYARQNKMLSPGVAHAVGVRKIAEWRQKPTRSTVFHQEKLPTIKPILPLKRLWIWHTIVTWRVSTYLSTRTKLHSCTKTSWAQVSTEWYCW